MKNVPLQVEGYPNDRGQTLDKSVDDAKWLLGAVAMIWFLVFSTGFLAALLGA